MSEDKLVNRKLKSPDTWLSDLEYQIPKNCPHCNYSNMPTIFGNKLFDFNKNKKMVVIGWKCTNCFEKYITSHSRSNSSNEKNTEFLFIYPSLKSRKFSNNIEKLSPKFIEIYTEAAYSEHAGHYSSAGIAYRLALEILIKDYAIQELDKDKDEVSKKKLYSAIEEYLPNTNFQKVADVIRLKGNDYTHFKEKFDEVTFDTMKDYFNIFIDLIDVQLKIKHPPIGNRE